MELSDWVGFAGVSLLLVAFFLNLANKLGKNSMIYILLNIIGAGTACMAAIFIEYTPFIILEGTWTLVSVWALIDLYFKKK